MLSIAELLNIKEKQHAVNGVKQSVAPVVGAAAEYKKYISTSKFKLVVYFKADAKGNYYTQYDKEANKNRRYIPSIDFMLTNGVMVQNHEVGFVKLVDYVLKNIGNIINAHIILNDYINELEHTIIKFNCTDISQTLYINPTFKAHSKGGVYFDSLDGEPLRTDKMRFNFIK